MWFSRITLKRKKSTIGKVMFRFSRLVQYCICRPPKIKLKLGLRSCELQVKVTWLRWLMYVNVHSIRCVLTSWSRWDICTALYLLSRSYRQRNGTDPIWPWMNSSESQWSNCAWVVKDGLSCDDLEVLVRCDGLEVNCNCCGDTK